jgi:hypothetical protein
MSRHFVMETSPGHSLSKSSLFLAFLVFLDTYWYLMWYVFTLLFPSYISLLDYKLHKGKKIFLILVSPIYKMMSGM